MKKPFLIILLLVPSIAYVQLNITVSAGNHDRFKCPVSVFLTRPFSTQREIILTEVKTNKEIPAQLLDSVTLVFIVDSLKAKDTRRYLLNYTPEKKSGVPAVTVEQDQKGFLIRSKRKPMLY